MEDNQESLQPQSNDEIKKDVISEIQESLINRDQRRRIFPKAALVGLGAGLVASLFRMALAEGDVLRDGLIVWAQQFTGYGWIFPVLLSIVGAVLSVLIIRNLSPEASGSGIPHLEAVLLRLRLLNWKRVLPVKFIDGAIAIGSGLTLGREGPTVQMGGAV